MSQILFSGAILKQVPSVYSGGIMSRGQIAGRVSSDDIQTELPLEGRVREI